MHYTLKARGEYRRSLPYPTRGWVVVRHGKDGCFFHWGASLSYRFMKPGLARLMVPLNYRVCR